MKIERQKSDRVDQTDDSKAKDKPSKEGDKDAFKELLERKSGKKGGKRGQKSAKKTVKDASGRQSGTKKPLAKSPSSRQASAFGERLKDGKLQLGQQTEQSERLGTERHTKRHHSETRVEHGHRKTHRREVHKEHARHSDRSKSAEARPHAAVGRSQDGAKRLSPKLAARAAEKMSAEKTSAENNEAPLQTGSAGASEPAGSSKAGAAGAASGTRAERAERRAQVAELARKLVDKAHVGHDASGRQIMLLDLEVPGRGNVRVRLRRRGEGFELRMRPQSDDLARDLRHEREHFRQSAAESGVDFTSIEIV